MNGFVEVMRFLLPALVLAGAVYFAVRSFIEYKQSISRLEIQKSRQEIITPARMQAYERIILFLERTTPENLMRRVIKTSTSARLFQADLVAAVRSEYEHNISQQVYMSPVAWAMVKTATEETIHLVNIAGSKLSASATASDLAHKILEITSQVGKFPTQVAIDNIKKEFAEYYMNPVASLEIKA